METKLIRSEKLQVSIIDGWLGMLTICSAGEKIQCPFPAGEHHKNVGRVVRFLRHVATDPYPGKSELRLVTEKTTVTIEAHLTRGAKNLIFFVKSGARALNLETHMISMPVKDLVLALEEYDKLMEEAFIAAVLKGEYEC